MLVGFEKIGLVLILLCSKKVVRILCKWLVKFWYVFFYVRYIFFENVLRKKWIKKFIVDLL